MRTPDTPPLAPPTAPPTHRYLFFKASINASECIITAVKAYCHCPAVLPPLTVREGGAPDDGVPPEDEAARAAATSASRRPLCCLALAAALSASPSAADTCTGGTWGGTLRGPSVAWCLLRPAQPRPVQPKPAAWLEGSGTCVIQRSILVGSTFPTGRSMSDTKKHLSPDLPTSSALTPSPPPPSASFLIPQSHFLRRPASPPDLAGEGGQRSWSSFSPVAMRSTTTAAPSPWSSGPTSLDPQS